LLLHQPRTAVQGVAFDQSHSSWVISAACAIAVGVVYFLAARLSLALLTNGGVAVFWPAAGVSAGVLIGFGPRMRLPVIVGVVAATLAANLLGDRNIPSSLVFAACNAFETVLVADLIERYFGGQFRLDSLRRVFGFAAAAIVGCIVSGIGGTAGYLLFHQSTTSPLIIWYHWVTADAIGILTVAPFIFGLVAMARDRPSLQEFLEGAAALLMLAAAGVLSTYNPHTPWDNVAIVSIFPLLLWIAARCRPGFASASTFVVTVTIVWMITFEIGLFGEASIPIGDRILTAQAIILGLSLCALVLGALFAERREIEMRLQEALTTGRAMAFDWDARSDLSRRSENAKQLLGLDPRGNKASFFKQIHPEDRQYAETRFRALRPENPSIAMAYRYLRPDGVQVWLELTARAEFDAVGRVIRLRGLAADITDHKRFEEKLAQAQKAAEQAQKTAEQAQKAAEQANRAKSAFLAAASHDLRQPLQTLKLSQEILEQQIQDGAARESIAQIGRSLETMTDMLTSLLDINQLEVGALRPSKSDFRVRDILEVMAADFMAVAHEKGLRLRVVRSAMTVHSDKRMLKEMVRNLLSNAVRYTDRGSILLGCRRAGDKLRIEVWDSGVGIMGDQVPRIFEEYYQGPQSAQSGGFGLGLAIVQRLANTLNHPVDVRSTPGKGSVFSIEVPLGCGITEAEIEAPLQPDRSHCRFSHMVLVIEDESSVRVALQRWLRLEGLEVVSVATGNEALALVTDKGLRPDLVLSDYNIPGPLDGMESIHALRAALARKIPAVVMTGDTRSAVIEAIAAHDVAIAVKPMQASRLWELINNQLVASESRQAL
jgi:PAS domain S-box-containing protein